MGCNEGMECIQCILYTLFLNSYMSMMGICIVLICRMGCKDKLGVELGILCGIAYRVRDNMWVGCNIRMYGVGCRPYNLFPSILV